MVRYDRIKPAILKSKERPLQKFSEDVRKAFEQIYQVLDFHTNKDSFTVDGNVHCKDLYVDPSSIYLGTKKLINDNGTLKFDGEEIGTGGTMRGVAVFVSETEPTEAEENDIWIKPA